MKKEKKISNIESNSELNSLEKDSILSLLLKYSLPAIIGTTAMSLYNIIDRIFIGQGVGPMAISGLALTFPLMNMGIAFSTLVGIGASAIISIRLGEGRKEEANQILCNAFILNIIIAIIYSIVFLFFLDEVLFKFGASHDTLPYAREFMQIMLAGTIITHIFFGLNNIMRASGYPKKAMISLLVTVGLNVILAPIFIFWFDLGIRGAAISTITSQFAGMIMVLFHFLQTGSSIRFVKDGFKLKWKIAADIFSIGMSPFMMHLCASIVIIFMNKQLLTHGGDLSVGAYGIIMTVAGLFAMIIVGLNQGMQPILGYNFGAKNYPRVFGTFKYGVLAATAITTLGFLLCEIIPRPIASAFTSDEAQLNLTVTGMRIIFMVFPIIGFQMVTSNFFQAIGKAKISIFLTLSRQMLFLIPALAILPRFWELTGVWLAAPTADVTSATVTAAILYWQLKKMSKERPILESK